MARSRREGRLRSIVIETLVLVFGVAGAALAARGESADGPGGGTPYRVAIIDMFYPGDASFGSEAERLHHLRINGVLDADRDRIPEPYYHGDIVSIYVSHPDVEILPYQISNLAGAKEMILRHLEAIDGQVGRGEQIDALVLSWESSTLISALEKPLRPGHAERYKAQIRSWGEDSASWRQSYNIIRALEKLVDRGVRVFTIAGNSGAGMVNTYSLARGAITVGSEEDALRGSYVADNVFVDLLAQSAYRIELVRDPSGTAWGYDLDEDGRPDIPLERVSSYAVGKRDYPRDGGTMLTGSSYAAPTELRRRITLRSASFLASR